MSDKANLPSVAHVRRTRSEARRSCDQLSAAGENPYRAAGLGEVRRILRPGSWLVVVALSKEGRAGFTTRLYGWGHDRFPALLDCRPIYAERLLRANGVETAARRMQY